ncbi:mechanosensitive ion channel family protein [Pseudobacteriovorax antillogorgiicola]|uniref:Mechanosensitive ion channel n=1 Tax=Pseudobacteriovorax antillogorgiicola TaxID=1513793 RepID=A0A1Y6CWA2_9BACT|nr:mechanosensitive ion channel domain-containing protein [Pseudobacteriovorax antillogorgiicola]TCS42752.1 mechanosensitive ion channel-like protein [Pseudobacteriovorax antillogorgiicola]SMF82250.1 Mechanosensitive ion channel [Pseudobacteriovorax antillogorgiicola]
MFFDKLEDHFYMNLLTSFLLIALIIFVRSVAVKYIRKLSKTSMETRRKWIAQTRNYSIFVALIGLFLVWSTELKTVAVTLLALAVAFVIATKELLLCFLGWVLMVSSKEFDVGDRIEVGTFRGDVVNYNIFTTTLYEVGPGKEHHQFTGRMVVMPNSILLSTPITNESVTGRFVLHVFRVPLKRSDDWQLAADRIIAIANEQCAEFIEEARKQFVRVAEKQVIQAPSVEPRLHYSFNAADQVDLVIRIPTPSKQKGKIEQAILQKFMTDPETLAILKGKE